MDFQFSASFWVSRTGMIMCFDVVDAYLVDVFQGLGMFFGFGAGCGRSNV